MSLSRVRVAGLVAVGASLLATCLPAWAEEAAAAAPATATASAAFDSRVQAAREAEKDPAAKPFFEAFKQQTLPHIAEVIGSCTSSEPPKDLRPIRLVADIAADGKPANVEINPSSYIGRCVSVKFTDLVFPAPPETATGKPFPFTIQLNFSINGAH